MEIETRPRHRLADTVRGLARAADWHLDPQARELFEPESAAKEASPDWVGLAGRLGVELCPIRLDHGELEGFLRSTGPVVLHPVGEPDRMVAIVRGRTRWSRMLEGEGRRRVPTSSVHDVLTDQARRSAAKEARALVSDLDLSPERLDKACLALADERLYDQTAVEGWRLMMPPGAPLRFQLQDIGVTRKAIMLLLGHGMATLLLIASWWMIGRGALEGHLDRGWLWAWALLIATTIPLRGLVDLVRGSVAWQAGAVLKRRLLHGALRLEVEEVRGQGAGEWLGRIIDSERVEALAMNGGLLALLAGLELILAATVLFAGVAPWAHLGLLVVCCAALVTAAAAFLHRLRTWTGHRLDMTHRLVERLVGHRTRVAQQPRPTWHLAEDQELEAYARDSVALDRWLPRLQVLLPRGWLIVALLVLLPAAIYGDIGPGRLAVSLGGCIMAFGAIRAITAGVVDLAGATIAWGNIEILLQASARPDRLGVDAGILDSARQEPVGGEPERLLVADGIAYRHAGREREVLNDVSLEVFSDDRILLEGPSGGGKSTLTSLLAGLRTPSQGWLGLYGLDAAVLGEGAWRRHVVCVPQAHENHLVTAPLAFNLLMGPRWPATAQDLDEARQVCRELGLGPLLERMPAGIQQPVGESGWQLSQGERHRVYLARALLSGAEMVIFDESFAGLDLENLERALTCVDRRAKTLLVIAHP